jgi:hypothetical protein
MASSLNGTGLTFSSGATLNSPPVTSVATGNGLSGGTITTTGTLAIAAPGFNTVGSYAYVGIPGTTTTIASGASLSAGSGNNQVVSSYTPGIVNNLSGTWRWMGATTPTDPCRFFYAIACRIS